MTDLSLVLFDDIYEELKKRYDSFLLVTLTNRDNKIEVSAVNYSGGQCACLGLAKVAEAKILRDAIN